MFFSSQDVLLMLSETTSPQILFPSDCITLYHKNLRGGGICMPKGRESIIHGVYNQSLSEENWKNNSIFDFLIANNSKIIFTRALPKSMRFLPTDILSIGN